jgi:nucleoid-associated protein YgaU
LFCDTTDQGIGINARSVTYETDKYYQLVKIVPTLHAPPVVTFYWHHEFSGNRVAEAFGSNRRTSFTGVAESVRQRFTLFSPEGVPLRALVTLVLREWRPIEQQLRELNLHSPDRTHRHVLASGESLSAVATRYYDRSSEWRRIATGNDIEDPRRLKAGAPLVIPPIR